jgi:hypothetical protein
METVFVQIDQLHHIKVSIKICMFFLLKEGIMEISSAAVGHRQVDVVQNQICMISFNIELLY